MPLLVDMFFSAWIVNTLLNLVTDCDETGVLFFACWVTFNDIYLLGYGVGFVYRGSFQSDSFMIHQLQPTNSISLLNL